MALLLVAALPAPAGEERGAVPGRFDYWVLALSWSPGWCAVEGAARSSPQCAPGARRGWVLHGLWPQRERGWPAWCPSPYRPPSRSRTRAEAEVFGTAGNAWHQWRKHGSCSGLDPDGYYRLAREALARIRLPGVFSRLPRDVRLDPELVERAFREVNPGLDDAEAVVVCRGEVVTELRICLDRRLEPRRCGPEVGRDCSLRRALMPAPG